MDPVDQSKDDVGTQTYRKDVDRGIDVPAEPFGELLEHNDRRIARADKEHIHALSQTELYEAVKSKGDPAQGYKGNRGISIVRYPVATALGETDEQPYKNKEHMPDTGMECQKQVAVQQPRRLCKGYGTAKQVIQHHKTIHTALQLSRLQPRCDQAHIHGNAAQLKRKVTPGIAVIHHYIIVEELFKNLGQGQNQSAEKQNAAHHLVIDAAKLPSGESANCKSN